MKIKKVLILLIITLTATGCYRIPDDDEFSVVPTTNNPSVTKQRNSSLLPGVSY